MWRFLSSEMMVILGLVENASRTDAEIADLYGMSKGTVASVRRRLLDAGAMFFVNVPAFNKLGCELMVFHSGKLDLGHPSESRTNAYMDFMQGAPEVFHAIIGGGNLSMFSVFRNVTEMEKFTQNHHKFFTGARRASKANLRNTMFPYALSRGTYTTNFTPIVHQYFGLDVPKPEPRPQVMAEVTEPDLSDNEKGILVEMVSDPVASDKGLAAKVGLSRQAVTRIRNKLYDEGYLTRVCIPHLYRWGFEMYVVSYAVFSMEMRWDIRMKSEPKDMINLSFFTLNKADEGVTNHMIPRYQDYLDGMEDAESWHHETKVFDEPPEMIPFSLERSTELKTLDFGPAVKSLLTENGGRPG